MRKYSFFAKTECKNCFTDNIVDDNLWCIVPYVNITEMQATKSTLCSIPAGGQKKSTTKSALELINIQCSLQSAVHKLTFIQSCKLVVYI